MTIKEKLSEDLNTGEHKKGKKKGNKENETTKLNNTYSDTMRMKKNKLFRSEVMLNSLFFHTFFVSSLVMVCVFLILKKIIKELRLRDRHATVKKKKRF